MRYDLDRPIERRHTDSIKWNRYEDDVLALWVADMDFVSPQPVLDALQARVAHGIFGYPRAPAELPEVIQARLKHLYGWQVATEDIFFIPGVVTGLNMAAHAFCQAGDGVLIQPPVYYPFLAVPANASLVGQYNQVRLNGGRYEMDLDDFERTITDRTRLLILCNPHNPVGRVYERAELDRLAELCLRHRVILCSDEIHCDLIYSGHQHIPIASLSPEVAQNTVTLMAPSKTFNIPGLSSSFVVIQNPELRSQFRAAHAGLVSMVNLLGYTAALAAYRDGQEWLEQVLAYLEANRDLIQQVVRVHLPAISTIVPEGTYLAWLDCRNTPIADQPAGFFLEKARVALNEGASFGPGGEGFVRLNFACPRSTLVEALDRMSAAYKLHAGKLAHPQPAA